MSTTKTKKTKTNPFAGGEDNGYFIRESATARWRSRFDPCLEHKLM
jgi:hypothetical protein